MAGLLRKVLGLASQPTPRSGESISFERDDSDWRALFDDASILANPPRQIEEAQARLMGRLSRVYQVFDRQSGQQTALLQSVIGAIDYCEGLDPRPAEVGAVRELLLGALLDQGVVPWAPAIGERMPEGCEPVAEEISAGSAPLTVLKVVTPGYLWRGNTVLRRPRIVIAGATAEAEPPQGDVSRTGAGEPAAEPAGEEAEHRRMPAEDERESKRRRS